MSVKQIKATRYVQGIPETSHETLTREEALQITINGKPYTVTMRTPGQDRLLTAGLLFSEGIITRPDDILTMRETPSAMGDCTLSVDAEIHPEILAGQNIFNRAIASSASCGVCGKTDICDLVVPRYVDRPARKLDTERIPEMLEKMRERQTVFETTGGSHAAALFTADGRMLAAHEDIGRHNAVDKVIGELFLQDSLSQADVLVVSGRVSYEIVAKCAQAKIPFLLAVSAPSSLAVESCDKAGIALIAFCRNQRFTVYTHPENIEERSWETNETLI